MNPRQVEFYRQDQHDVIHMANRMFVILLILQCIGLIFAAAFITPRTWIGTTSYVHMHLWAAIILGPILTIGPIVLVYLQPTATLTRHVVAAAQVMYSALLIHMTGGRIETHFHVFGSLAFLAFYRDPWVIVSASGLIAVDHAVRGIVAPESVFGVFSSGNWRWVEHAGWVIFEDLFLLISIHRANRMTWDKASLSVDLMKRHEHAERLVAERTVALETALEKAETSSRAKSDFLRNISHEVRTPLNAILGFADLLEFDAQEENKELLQAIQRNGTNLLSMMRQVLALSELESGKSVANKSIVDLQVLCDHLVRKHRPSAEAKELSLTIEDSSVFPKELMSDPQHIETILDHLLHNAVKFTAF
ncbi:MAG: sensor histidine kinase, partial [Phycisphaerae bacterium]